MKILPSKKFNNTFLFIVFVQYLIRWVDSQRKDLLPSSIKTTIGGNQGDWELPKICSENKFVNGYQLIFEQNWINGISQWSDFTGLNGIRIFCSDMNFLGNEELRPGDGPFPQYFQTQIVCGSDGKNSFIIGYELYLGGEKDGALGIKGICSDFYGENVIYVDKGEFDFNVQKESATCPPGTIVCGMQLRIEVNQGTFSDDSALNDLRVFCCRVCLSDRGRYLNEITKTCEKCHFSCKTCSGMREDECLTCYNDDKLENNKCIPISSKKNIKEKSKIIIYIIYLL